MPTSTSYEYRVDPKKYENEINKLQLPKDGEFPYVIPRSHTGSHLPKENYENKKGYRDDFGNIWVKGPCHQHGSSDPFEWDVQLSPKGKNLLKEFIGSAKHANVSINGKLRKNK